MKTVLLLVSDNRHSLPLIRFLAWEGKRYGWRVCVGSVLGHNAAPIRNETFSTGLIFITTSSLRQCDHAIRKADLVVALIPGALLVPVTERCIFHSKALITPWTINPQRIGKKFNPDASGSLILSECGFSPGLDHITIKKAIDLIQNKGGRIHSLRTFAGSLISEKSIDSPWEFKLTEPGQSYLDLGRGNNTHLVDGQVQHVPYPQLFARLHPISVPGVDATVAFPEGNALACNQIYGLHNVDTVIKGRIIRSGFEKIWQLLMRLGLTDPTFKIEMTRNASFYNFLDSLLPYSRHESVEYRLMRYLNADDEDIEKLKFLGLFDKTWVNSRTITSAHALLGYLMDENLSLQYGDKDNVIMQHELAYHLRTTEHKIRATLVAEGSYPYDSAMAKAVGLTTAAAAKAFLLGNIKVKGFCLPLTPDIYEPVLHDLTDLGVNFHFDETQTYTDGQISFNLNLN